MSTQTETLLAEVLKLPPSEQDEFVGRLLDQLDPPGSSGVASSDEAFVEELNRRAEEMRVDSSAGVPWETVREMR